MVTYLGSFVEGERPPARSDLRPIGELQHPAFASPLTLRMVLTPEFRAFLRNAHGVDRRVSHAIRSLHEMWAQMVVDEAAHVLREGMRGNPRPNREREMGLRRALSRSFGAGPDSPIIFIKHAGWTNAGLTVDFNQLDHYVRDDKGRPYWRYVESGWSATFVGFFDESPELGGRLHAPRREMRFKHPRFPQSSRGVPIEAGHPGYGFVETAIERARKDIPSRAMPEYVAEMAGAFPGSEDRILGAFRAGGRVVVQRGPGGRFISGARTYFRGSGGRFAARPPWLT